MDSNAASHGDVGTGRANLEARKALQVRLIVTSGRAQGQGIDVPGPRFVIGRAPECHLRPNNPMISRVHAVIEQREGRVWIRDQGTTNGTRLGDKVLRGEEAEARNGETLQIGPLSFRFAVEGQAPFGIAGHPEPPAGQILEAGGEDLDASTEVFIIKPFESSSQTISVQDISQLTLAKSLDSGYLSFAVVLNTLVVTVIPHELTDPATIEPIRYALSYTLELDLPRRVILDLSHVEQMSQRGLVMLLAQARRFEKANGSLRICHLSPSVAAFVESQPAPIPIGCHPSVDEAVKAAARG